MCYATDALNAYDRGRYARDLSAELVALSKLVDHSPANRDRDPEALSWHRVTKASEEAGEATRKWLGVVGGNPRKGVYATVDDVAEELVDTAISALSAVEHLYGNVGVSMKMMADRLQLVTSRLQIPEEES